MPDITVIIPVIFLVALLYSSVGHGGASGYLAVMALMAVAPEVTRPTALTLNIFVASIAAFQYHRTGHFSWRLFLPFAAASIPAAFIGGTFQLPTDAYKLVLGVVLIAAAARLIWNPSDNEQNAPPPVWLAVLIGSLIGILSGLVGVGGGIFLTPILLLFRWSSAKTAAGVSALFILVNSAAGLAGSREQVALLPPTVIWWIAAAALGGLVGSTIGAKWLASIWLRRLLAIVLLVAGAKLLFA